MTHSKFLTRRKLLAGVSALPLTACAVDPVARPAPTGQFVEVSGTRLHYVEGGTGPSLILLHGASGHLKEWTFRLFDTLSQSYRVLAFDRPGLGFSETGPETASLTGQSKLLQSAARKLGFGPAIVLGHSYGGSVALNWALTDPANTKAVVAVSAPSQVWPGSAGRHYDIANTPLIGPVFSALVPLLASERRVNAAVESIFAPQPVPEGYLAHMQPEISTRPSVFRANTAQVGRLKDDMRAMVPQYEKLNTPVELLHGTADAVVPIDIHAEKTALALPNVNFTRLEGLGHMPHHTDPAEIIKAIARVA